MQTCTENEGGTAGLRVPGLWELDGDMRQPVGGAEGGGIGGGIGRRRGRSEHGDRVQASAPVVAVSVAIISGAEGPTSSRPQEAPGAASALPENLAIHTLLYVHKAFDVHIVTLTQACVCYRVIIMKSFFKLQLAYTSPFRYYRL